MVEKLDVMMADMMEMKQVVPLDHNLVDLMETLLVDEWDSEWDELKD